VSVDRVVEARNALRALNEINHAIADMVKNGDGVLALGEAFERRRAAAALVQSFTEDELRAADAEREALEYAAEHSADNEVGAYRLWVWATERLGE
jgi:hypothetical protein